MAVSIVAVSGGSCVTLTGNKILNKKYNENDKAQRWIVEKHSQDPNKLAFQSEANGQYLHASSGAPYGIVITGAKQWWIVESGPAPGSFWLKCSDYPDAQLCNSNGSYVDNNKIYCWPKQANWTHALTWYLQGQTETKESDSVRPTDDEVSNTAAKEKEILEREGRVQAREVELREQEDRIRKGLEALKTREEQMQLAKNKMQAQQQGMDALRAELDALKSTTSPVNVSDVNKADLLRENKRLCKKLGAIKDKQPKQFQKDIPNGKDGAHGSSEIDHLRAELAQTQDALAKARQNAVVRPFGSLPHPTRKIPPIVRPAQNLPRGFDPSLTKPVIAMRDSTRVMAVTKTK